VPVLIGLVTVALRLRLRFFPAETVELAGVKSCAGSFPAPHERSSA
jgi:arsenite transporter